MPPFLIPLISPLLNKLLDFIPDPAARTRAALEAEQSLRDAEAKALALIAEQNSKQADINLVEAGATGSTWFKVLVAGWRPALGWVCVFSFFWAYICVPMVTFFAALFQHPFAPPVLDNAAMEKVLMGMLGLAGLRTYEKKTDSEGNR